MTATAGGNKVAQRWQDVRAREMDAKFDADRRRVGKRAAVNFRWVFLIVLAALNKVTTVTTSGARGQCGPS